MKQIVLIVEDNPVTAMDLQAELETASTLELSVGIASSYEQALEFVKQTIPDCIVIDIDLQSSKDGIDLASELRRRNLDMPLIYLTADHDLPTKKRAAATLPTTYLPKPFVPDVLRSAVEMALLTYKPQEDIYLTDGIFYRFDTQMLYADGKPVSLTPREKRLIEYFAKRPHGFATAEVLSDVIWEGDPPLSGHALRTLIYRLQTKLPKKLFAHDNVKGYYLKTY